MATEFGKLAARRRIPFPPSVSFPDHGAAEADILAEIARRRADDPWDVEGDFALAYAGPPHPIAARAARLVQGSIFVEWVEDMYPAAFRLEKEAVSMMASLLGAPDGVGFLTTGGTESNISAVRLARDIGAAAGIRARSSSSRRAATSRSGSAPSSSASASATCRSTSRRAAARRATRGVS